MRGISKPWPPGDVYPGGNMPVRLSYAESAYLSALPGVPDKVSFARSEFDRLEKPKLRSVMYREQHSLCIYCEKQITEVYPPPRIDHWQPISLKPALALRWRNLYLSCTTPDTCDSAKGNRPLQWDAADAHMPWPVDRPYEDVVGFTSLGEIYVRSDVVLSDATRRALELAIADRPDGAQIRRSIVNLNHPALIAARAAAVDGERMRMNRDFKGRTATTDEREQRATQLLDNDQRPQFVSIRVAWLRNRLRRGQ